MSQGALVFAAGVAASLFTADIAGAQNKAAAEAAFDLGRSLAASGDYAGACAKFEESERAEPAVGTLLNLADCNEKLGLTASAWAALKEAAARAELAGEHGRAEAAAARGAALESSLSRLQIVPPESGPQDFQIRRDGLAVGSTVAGTAVPVDPGAHVIEAVVGGTVRWSRRLDIPRGPSLVVVVVPELGATAGHTDAALVRGDVNRAATATAVPESLPPNADAGTAISRAPTLPMPRSGEPPRTSAPADLWTLARSPQETAGFVTLAAGAGGILSAAVAGIGAVVAKSENDEPRALGWAQAFDWIVVPSAIAVLAGTLLLATSPHRAHVPDAVRKP